MDVVRRGLVSGLRAMMRRPLTSLISVLCLGLGVAVCAVAWTLVDAAILRPFGLPDSDRLVVVWEADRARSQDLIEISHPNFLDWQEQARTVESMAAFGSSHWPALARLQSEVVPLAVRGVSRTFFATLGIQPAVGRDFAAADLAANSSLPVMLSHRFWQSRFAGDPAIVGQVLFIDGDDHTIVGVMPRGFAFPDDPDAWVSLERALGAAFAGMPEDQQRKLGILEVVGRRRPGMDNGQVEAELTGIVGSLRRRHDPSDATVTAVVTPYAEVLLGRLGSRLWITLGLAAAVFLFACANLAAVRAAGLRERSAELAARRFLGASRSRLGVELAVEMIPLIGAGIVLAAAIWRGLAAALSGAAAVESSGISLVEHRGPALLVAVLLCGVSWLLAAALPAWAAGRGEATHPSSTRVARRVTGIGAPLLFGQAAVAIAVVAVAGAALQAFQRLAATDVGFATSGVTLVDATSPGWKYATPAERRRLGERLQDALRTLPGVRHVAAVSVRPFRFGEIADGLPVRRGGDALVTPDEATPSSRVVVTPDYFAALGQPIVEGRPFSVLDRTDSETVAIVSRTLARALWGDEPALGKRLETFTLSEKWRGRVVVGIAGDARYRGLERPSMEVYIPHTQAATELGSFVLGVAAGAPLGDAAVRQALGQVEPEMAIERIQTTGALVHTVLGPARLLAMLATLLGGAGLLLLALGIFGATATALRAAWGEIGVRQAIGAMPLQAARAPLRILARALLVGMIGGLLAAPVALSAAAGLGLRLGSGGILWPLAAGVLSVLAAAAAAAGPSLWQTSRVPPADLLREH